MSENELTITENSAYVIFLIKKLTVELVISMAPVTAAISILLVMITPFGMP